MARREKLSTAKIKSGGDAVAYAVKKGCWRRNGHGDHAIVGNDRGQTVIPLHRELRTGTRHAILKAFAAMGIAMILAALILPRLS